VTRFVQHGDDYAFDAAEFFDSLAKDPAKLDDADFFDEHSLDQQRAYDIACWIAGSSDEYYRAIRHAGVFSRARLERCPAEFRQIADAWETLLRPHFNPVAVHDATTTTTTTTTTRTTSP